MGALEPDFADRPRPVVAALGATETVRPARLKKVVSAPLVAGESSLELGQIPLGSSPLPPILHLGVT